MYRRLVLPFCCILSLFFTLSYCSGYMPAPDKVVIVVLENHSYSQIAGSPAAPFINSLINDSMTAVFTQSYGLSHPSQPNYIQLFSGSNQGVTSNNMPANLPFTAPNLYTGLAAVSKTFTAYSQGLPSAGFTGETFAAYARKHAPWVNWQGALVNDFPPALHQPFTSFPSNYSNLPHVSIVVPDQNNDMHSGSDPARITTCDTWIQNNLGGYIQWARTNNSLFILTFDEDDNLSSNRILTFFTGPMVYGGFYSNHIDHYSILRMIEDMFGTAHAGAASTAATIDYCWKCPQAAAITQNGPSSFCFPGNTILSATAGSEFLWSNGATTQNINIDSTGTYRCRVVASSGCISMSNSIPVTVNHVPVISSFTPGAMTGRVVTINGSGLSGTSVVSLNGNPLIFSIVSDSKIIFTVPVNATSGYITIINNCGVTQTSETFIVVPPIINLSLKVFIESLYKGTNVMKAVLSPSLCDTVNVELRQSISPYGVAYSLKAILDTNGNAILHFPGDAWGTPWFISVKGRNTLSTWSAAAVNFQTDNSYDFTDAASKAFGSNQKYLSSGVFAMYSGDLNQDDLINLNDIQILNSKLVSFLSGYSVYDLNGDLLIEMTDATILENNLFLSVQRP